MMNRQARWLIRIRNALCVLYLLLFVLFETYSAAATALDHSDRFPTWEVKLGWCLLILPLLLAAGLVFLLRSARESIGFYLIGGSVVLYLAFLFLENALVHDRTSKGDLVSMGIWVVLCSVATAAAWLLKRSLTSELSE